MVTMDDNFFGTARYILLYDAHCPVCRRSVDFLLRQRGADRLRPLPLQTPGILARFNIQEEAAMRELHVVDRKGAVRAGADGVLLALGALPLWRWTAVVRRVPPLMWAGRRVYRYIASNRKRDQCEEGTCHF